VGEHNTFSTVSRLQSTDFLESPYITHLAQDVHGKKDILRRVYNAGQFTGRTMYIRACNSPSIGGDFLESPYRNLSACPTNVLTLVAIGQKRRAINLVK
jgi:hypothetical protein